MRLLFKMIANDKGYKCGKLLLQYFLFQHKDSFHAVSRYLTVMKALTDCKQ